VENLRKNREIYKFEIILILIAKLFIRIISIKIYIGLIKESPRVLIINTLSGFEANNNLVK